MKDLVFISCEYEKLIDVAAFSSDRLFNLHFSRLPAHKGSFPLIHAILQGDKEVGVTLHRIDHGIDTGPIIAQLNINVSTTDSALDTYMACQVGAIQLIRESLPSLLEYNPSETREHAQMAEGSTFASRHSLDFESLKAVAFRSTAEQVRRQVAAANFRPYQLPEAFGNKLSGVSICAERSIEKYGSILDVSDAAIRVATIDYDVDLRIDRYPELWDACFRGDAETVANLVDSVDRLDEWDARGLRALSLAARARSPETIAVLLQAGASTAPLDGTGRDLNRLLAE